MIFQLGGIPWNKGKKRPPFSKEWIAKMKLARQGRKPFLGHHHSEKSKKKTSESMKKNGWYPPSPFGRKHSEETRIKIGFSQQGNKSHRWKGGKTNKNCLIRNSVLYKLWREKVFERDKFTCQNCKKIGGKLNADHKENGSDSTAAVKQYDADYVNIGVSAGNSKLLILGDLYYPGWKAYIDGGEVKIYPVNYVMRGVFIPKGRHTVEFIYRPKSFLTRVTISLLTVCITISVIGIKMINPNHDKKRN